MEGGRTYSDVAIHLKGAAGSFQPVTGKPGLTLNFDKHVKGQNFHGLEKLSLNNSRQDPTYISEKIARELFEKAGVPVPRADHAVVTLNGRPLGLYVLVEGYNKQFLKRYFKNPTGNLYDGGFCQEITQHLNVNSGDNAEDQSDLAVLAEAAAKTREQNNLSELAKVLDLDRFITMIALEIALCHWDGYAMNRNNWRAYSDKESGKFVFMPHGLDQLFGVGRQGMLYMPIDQRMQGLVARVVVGTTEGRDRYLSKLREIRTNIFDVKAITKRIREIAAEIEPVSGHVDIDSMCRSIELRARNLDEQLGAPPKELKFGSDGTVALQGWQAIKMDPQARLEPMTGPDGSRLLYIGAGSGRASSWRTRAVLGQGRYRFEGRARTKGMQHPAFGAVLRVSGERQAQPMRGEGDWVQCAYEFPVEVATENIEFVCELRGNTGAVWFDAGSLKLRRLN
jgi:hypothetical protein